MIAFTGLSDRIAGWLVQASNQFFYPPLIALYSCVLGVFVPSGGSKWVIEAPYVLDAGYRLGVDAGWLVVVYDLGEASANLLQPFWMLPTLAILGLKARDVMGYTFAMFLVCFPVADRDRHAAGAARRLNPGAHSGVDGEEEERGEEHEVYAALEAGGPSGHHGQDADDDGQQEQDDLGRARGRAPGAPRARSRRQRWRGW